MFDVHSLKTRPDVADLLPLLQERGLHLPDDTHKGNFVARLHTACLTKIAHQQQAQAERVKQQQSKPVQPQQRRPASPPPFQLSISGRSVNYLASYPTAELQRMAQQMYPGARGELARRRRSVNLSTEGAGQWITIGGREGDDGKQHGGSPVYVEKGRITKGHPGLTGRRIDALDDSTAADSTGLRKQLAQGREYARATWAKKARQDGIDPKSLHQLAAEFLTHDGAFVDDRRQMLREARNALGEFGDTRALHLRAAKGIDADQVKGLDEVAGDLAEKHPHLFSQGQHASDTLLEMLTHGAGDDMSEDDAYRQAYDHLAGERERERQLDAERAIRRDREQEMEIASRSLAGEEVPF